MQKILEKLSSRTAPGARVARDVRILWRLKTGGSALWAVEEQVRYPTLA